MIKHMIPNFNDPNVSHHPTSICSYGFVFLLPAAVFHVTDQLGIKITDESLILYIQQVICIWKYTYLCRSAQFCLVIIAELQALCASRKEGISKELQNCLKREVRPPHVSMGHTALEITGTDRPGLLSEISAVLTQLECNVTAAVAWTHNTRAASIIYVEDKLRGGPITDLKRLAHVEEQLENVVDARHRVGEKRSVRLTTPVAGQTHTERRLHQLMYANMDYEPCRGCTETGVAHRRHCTKIHVSIESCKEKGYSVVNMRSRDRPKLLFDTLCALTDMQYVVFHAAVSSRGTMADQVWYMNSTEKDYARTITAKTENWKSLQEYFIRHKDGFTLDTECERHKLTQCLIAAVERRVSHVSTK